MNGTPASVVRWSGQLANLSRLADTTRAYRPVFSALFPLVNRWSQRFPGTLTLTVPTAWVLETVEDGDAHGWDVEQDWLWEHQPVEMNTLMRDVAAHGVRIPIDIAVRPHARPRMWDGHHRVVAAEAAGRAVMPVRFWKETN